MKKCLIVDDSVFMRNIIKKMLLNNGYTVAGEAENGKAAFEIYKEIMPDIVTLDVTMKEMSGLEALKEIIRYDPNAKVIMVSAMGQKSFIEEAAALGAKDFLIKPFNENTVISKVARLLEA